MPAIRLVTAVFAASLLLTACGGTADPAVEVSADALEADCAGQIEALEISTQEDVTFKNAKDLTTALTKLGDASAKLGIGKLADAVQKLDDYAARIAVLIGANKISGNDGFDPASLVAAADAAAACIIPE